MKKRDNMPAEVLSIGILKYLWVGVVVPAFIYLHKRLEKLRDDTFTKIETSVAIDAKLAPIIVEMRQSKESRIENTKAVQELSKVVVELRIALATK